MSNVSQHSMKSTFFAERVAASDEEWGRLVLFGSIEEMNGSPYLMFQGSYEHSAQDVALGQDKPYVEIGNQGWSWYGHMEHVVLERGRLSLQVSEEAKSQMQNDGHFLVEFTLDEGAFVQLRDKMRQIFANSSVFRSNSAYPFRQADALARFMSNVERHG